MEEERLNEAAELFQTSVRNWPNALAYDFLGEIAIKRNVPQEAERDFRAALDLDERDSNAHFGLGFVYRAAGRTADALRQYQAGLSIDPTDGRALAAVRELHPENSRPTP